MNRRILLALLGASVLATPAAAYSRGRGGGDWSILGADTVAPGNDVISGRLGWPDFTMEYTHGVNPGFDLGARFQLVFGLENRTDTTKIGFAGAVPLRWELSRHGDVHVLFHVDPGLRLYTYSPVLFGFQVPFGINLEFPISTPLKFGVGADFNATIFVTGDGAPYFFFGPLVGPWMEYRIDSRLALGIDTRFGAIIDAANGGTDTGFGLRVQMMLAYRL